MGKIKAIFESLCPNCHGRISDARLRLGSVCSKCLPVKVSVNLSYDELKESLEKQGTLKDYLKLYEFFKEVEEAEELFNKATGFVMWGAQRSWLKRLIKGRSFSIIASTGIGKTTFGVFMSLYLATRSKKSYLILPTTTLVRQVVERLQSMSKNVDFDVNVAFYHSKLKKSEKEEMKERIRNFEFDVLITSSQFLSKNFELLAGKKFDFVFIDDVDAFLKSSKNIEKVLSILGFDESTMALAKQVLVLLQNAEANREEIQKLREKIKAKVQKLKPGSLVVSTATGRARGRKIKLYRELLGFEIGRAKETLRNVVDCYIEEFSYEKLLELVKRLGKGGLVFVPVDLGVEEAEKIKEYLSSKGVKAGVVHGKAKKDLDEFVNGNLEVLVGVASYYGSLVRGIDLPHLIRYAIFFGVPKFKFSLELEDNLMSIISVANLLSELDIPEKKEVESIYLKLRKLLRTVDPLSMKLVEAYMKGERVEIREYLKKVANDFLRAKSLLSGLLKKEETIKALESYQYATLEKVEGSLVIKTPDVRTYIQASGRTSRLFAGGITKGLSVVLVDDYKVFHGLVRALKWMYPDSSFEDLTSIDLDKVLKEVDEDRKRVKAVMEGKVKLVTKDLVKSALMIVESPNKARTIANFFGKPSRRKVGNIMVYEINTGDYMLSIAATAGHVVDLTIRDGYDGVLKLDDLFVPVYGTIKKCKKCGEQFTEGNKCPKCGSEEILDKLELLENLREVAQEVDEVFIATDPDIEGNKIAWDVMLSLLPYVRNLYRAEFHEVTKHAILEAIKKKGSIDEKSVEAQIVRRVEDRWIGFTLSKILWRKFKNRNLSAGRVQTPVLGWIIQRVDEHKKSITVFTRISLENGLSLVVEGSFSPRYVKVSDVKKEVVEVAPRPPYTTDEMLKDASKLFGFSADYTMRLAQDLFEAGLCTYHRTDSTRVSNVGMAIAKDYITNEIGEDYVQLRRWGEGGAHECIRPTRAVDTQRLIRLIKEGVISPVTKLTKDHIKLYDMIFRRFIASQMKPAKVVKLVAKISVYDKEVEEEGLVGVVFDGWSKILPLPMKKVPNLIKGDIIMVKSFKKFKAAKVQLFTQGDVVSMMKERKIGRPSTYAKIVSTLLKRKYVFENKKKKLVSTKLGVRVFNFLNKNFYALVSEERTRKLEEEMDMVESGEVDYQKILHEVFNEIRKIAKYD